MKISDNNNIALYQAFADPRVSNADDTLTLAQNRDGSIEMLGGKTMVKAHGGDVACNRETLKLFREALSQQYGVFGEHAFDMELGARLSEGKALRSGDIKNVLNILDSTKASASRAKMIESRFLDELARQAESHPEVLKYGVASEVKARILELYRSPAYAEVRKSILTLPSQKDLSLFVTGMIRDQVKNLPEKRLEKRFTAELEKQLMSRPDIMEKGTALEVKNGVLNRFCGQGYTELRKVMLELQTKEQLSLWVTGMIDDRLNEIGAQKPGRPGGAPGVEGAPAKDVQGQDGDPNEIVGLRNLSLQFEADETSVEDRIKSGSLSSGMRVNSTGEKLVLEKLKTNGVEPGFIAHGDWTAEQTHEMMDVPGSVLARAAEDVLKNDLKKSWPEGDVHALRALKSLYFVEIRDAILAKRGDFKDMKGTSASRLSNRFIVKLDYNEGDSSSKTRGSSGKLRLPNRVRTDKGYFYHTYRLTTADKASVDAVREALANDITRALGIPAQELEIVRGKYSDGHVKLMLKAGFADGYKDFDGNFLKDGLVQQPGSNKPEDLGKYKVAFLLLADRDAVGSHGQNKGLRNGKFFAIDPGHSLQGNGKYLKVNDDFSFEDTKNSILEKGKRFANFSVFDDSNRSEKLKGWREVLGNHDKIESVFNSYKAKFTINGDNDPHKELKAKILAEIQIMKDELDASFAKMEEVFRQQVEVHTEITSRFGEDTADKIIDAVENFERATSPVKSFSEHGEVRLTHLAVIPKTRVKWSASVNKVTGSVMFMPSVPLTNAQAQKLNAFLEGGGFKLKKDVGGQAYVDVGSDSIAEFLKYFNEEKIREVFHPDNDDKQV